VGKLDRADGGRQPRDAAVRGLREDVHFSTLVLTAIFATYAVVLVPSLVLFGRLADRYGRRPVILAGLAVAAVALVVFALATGTAWLYLARALQGLSVGMISGAATAALVELDPDGDRRRAAMFAGLAQAGGRAAGPNARWRSGDRRRSVSRTTSASG
jgi:MFS family permease